MNLAVEVISRLAEGQIPEQIAEETGLSLYDVLAVSNSPLIRLKLSGTTSEDQQGN